jgi:anti-sigma regulatory factor (Ser/Thr protein kinase)
MATAAYAVLTPETGAVRIASAGHPPPVVISQAGEARLLDVTTSPPLGTLPFPTYNEVTYVLAPGETIVLYTDGLVERRGESLTEGLERLRATASLKGSANRVAEHILESLVPRLGAADDVAVVVLRNRPIEQGLRLRLPAEPDVLAQLRQALRRWLRSHGAHAEDVAAITLAVGEAAANAIEHAYAPGRAIFEIEAMHASGTVTLSVRDTGRWRRPRGTQRGRGLMMIEKSVDELDVRVTASGTEVLMRRRLGS